MFVMCPALRSLHLRYVRNKSHTICVLFIITNTFNWRTVALAVTLHPFCGYHYIVLTKYCTNCNQPWSPWVISTLKRGERDLSNKSIKENDLYSFVWQFLCPTDVHWSNTTVWLSGQIFKHCVSSLPSVQYILSGSEGVNEEGLRPVSYSWSVLEKPFILMW